MISHVLRIEGKKKGSGTLIHPPRGIAWGEFPGNGAIPVYIFSRSRLGNQPGSGSPVVVWVSALAVFGYAMPSLGEPSLRGGTRGMSLFPTGVGVWRYLCTLPVPDAR
jgi:hypothetical protein